MEGSLWKEKVRGNVMTVNGLIPADDMGITLPHEHLLIYTVYGGYGYAHILNNIVPLFRGNNISEEEIKTIMIENPKRVFPFQF